MATKFDRRACERRVYRLAVLLTGHRLAATRVIDRVMDAQPRLETVDPARLDRLAVLHGRELEPAMLVDGGLPPKAAERLATLPAQAREAWTLRRIFLEDERDAARAMDCSRSAHARHLEAADAVLDERAASAFRDWIVRLDLPAHHHRHRTLRRVLRRHGRRLGVLALLVLLAALAVAAWPQVRGHLIGPVRGAGDGTPRGVEAP